MKRTNRRVWGLLYSAIVVVGVAVGTLIQLSALGAWVEQKTYDVRFRLRGPMAPSPAAPITILAIDEGALARIPDPLMLWHRHFARMIDQLVEVGAGAIGLDFILDDVSQFDAEGQLMLSQSLLTAGMAEVPIVLAYRVTGAGVDQPPEALAFAASAVGHTLAYANLTTDSDDFVRRQELAAVAEESGTAPGFALAIAEAFSDRTGGNPTPNEATAGTILINYREPGHFRRMSFVTAMDALDRGDKEFLESNFRGRIVLIGRMGMRGDEDLHSTPHYNWGMARDVRESLRTPGIVIHANAITTVLEGDAIEELRPSMQLLATLALVSFVALTSLAWTPARGIAANLVAVGLFVLSAMLPAFAAGYWIFVVSPVSGAALAMGLAQTGNYVLEGRNKRQLRRLFTRYVDDRVIEGILKAPEELNLGGERRKIAVLFADIRNFTKRSEKTAPEDLVGDLNRYFNRIVRAIQSRGGMVDKFMGDGIMALFGVPLEQEDSSQRAVQAALGMIAALKELNAEFEAEGREPIHIGIGIHRGDVVVGNIGSVDRMEYTAIGDVVNTAARIESLTRKLEADILISDEICRELNEQCDIVSRGSEAVKGRSAEVVIHEVRGWSGGL